MPDRNRVLVVVDDDDVRSLFGREEFDAVLVAVMLPDHSGLDIVRWARGASLMKERGLR